MHDCPAGIDGLYIPLLLGAIYDSKDLAASVMDFAPAVWLNPLPDSGNGFGAAISESAFAAVDAGCSKFPHVSKIEDSPMSFADVERSQFQDVCNNSDYAEFSGLWNSNALRRLIKGELPKNANVVIGNRLYIVKLVTVEMRSSRNLGW